MVYYNHLLRKKVTGMKKFRGWLILLLLVLLGFGAVKLTLHLTAEYPALGEPVTYPVNQVEGFTLTMEKPTWSPFKGYTIRWRVDANSEEVYTFIADKREFFWLEHRKDGQWYRLLPSEEVSLLTTMEYPMGGDAYGLESSLTQKYRNYGTRLAPGTYRLVLEMQDSEENPHYLASEFSIK